MPHTLVFRLILKKCPFHFRKYEAQAHTAAEVKKECEDHLLEKEILEGKIPSNIIIGPFYINTENVRQALAKKLTG
jgi:dynein heavy chain